MNRNTAILATVIAASLGAFGSAAYADEADGSQNVLQATSIKSRAEVQAELAQFRGQANPWSTQYNPLASFQSTKTAAQVRAEAVQSRDETQAMNREDSGSAFLAAQGPVDGTLGTQFAGQAVNNAY